MKKLQWIAILLALVTFFVGCQGPVGGGGGTGGGSGNSGYTPPPLPDADVNYYVSVSGAVGSFNNVQDAIDLAVHSDNNGKVVHIHIDGTISEEVGSNGMVEIADAASTADIVLRGSSKGGTINATGKNKRAVYVNLPNGTVTFGDNLTITGGNVTGVGAGAQIINTPVVINGTTITGNVASTSGGGVIVAGHSANLILEYATITGNEAGSNGGGIYVTNNATLTLSGKVIVSQNTEGSDVNNIFKSSGTIALNGALASGSNIGITTSAAAGTTIVKAEDGYTITESDRKKIHNDKDGTLFALNGNTLKVPVKYVTARIEGGVLIIEEDPSSTMQIKAAINAAAPHNEDYPWSRPDGITSIRINPTATGAKIIPETSLHGLFNSFEDVTQITGLEHLDTSDVTAMESVFLDCTALERVDVSSWDVSNVTNMNNMFGGCASIVKIDLSTWNVGKLESMRFMFSGCTVLSELDIRGWNTPNVTDTSGRTDVSGGRPGAEYLFEGCDALTQDGIIKDSATISATIQAKIDAL